jgi:hypothetical protein
MTCRIDRIVTGEYVVVYISGQIVNEDVDTLRAFVEQEGNPVAIDLKDVLLVDREAVRFLALCDIRGIELRNSPAYIREWIAHEKAQIRTEGAE